MRDEKRTTQYSSKAAAIAAMWRHYNRHIRAVNGSPLIGGNGTILQWVDNGRGVTRNMYVTPAGKGKYMLVKSWIAG